MKLDPIVAIDPGTEESAVLIWGFGGTTFEAGANGRRILFKEILPNPLVYEVLSNKAQLMPLFIEGIASFGMPVGRETFETCYWIGKFIRHHELNGGSAEIVYRLAVKIHHCKTAKAKDANIAQALRDKYGEKGTKKKPGLLFGIKDHLWSAFAIATYITESRSP